MLLRPIIFSFIIFLLFGCKLCNAQQPKLMLPIGHTQAITSLQLSPDYKTLLSASEDKTVKLWSTSGYILLNLQEHSAPVNTAYYSNDGRSIVTASDDKTVKIFNIQTGTKTAEITSHTGDVKGAMFNKDGSKILSFSWDNTAKVSDAKTGALLVDFKGHSSSVNTAVYDLTGKLVLTASRDKTAILWDAGSGKILFRLNGHTDEIISAVFDKDGKKILTASFDGTAKVWETATGRLIYTLKGHTDKLNTGIFSPDGTKILTASYDQSARIWDAETGNLLVNLNDHPHWVESASFSPDGKMVLTQSAGSWYHESLRLWDAETGVLKNTFLNSGDNIELSFFSHSGKTVIGGFLGGNISAWDVDVAAPVFAFSGFVYSNSDAYFSADGKDIITQPNDATIRVWDASSGKLKESLREHRNLVTSVEYGLAGKKIISSSYDTSAIIYDSKSLKPLITLKGATGIMLYAHLSNDERKAVTVSKDFSHSGDTIQVWNAETGKLLFTWAENKTARYAAFSPDGEKLIISPFTGDAKVLDGETGKLLFELKNNEKYYQVRQIEFSKDGKYIAQSGPKAKVWDATDGKLLFTENEKVGGYGSEAHFSPDGNTLLVVYNRAVRLWDWRASKIITEIKRSAADFSDGLFSHDGKKMLIWKENAELELWDIKNAKLLHTLKGHKLYINSADFSPDDNSIVTSSADNTCILWNTETGQAHYTFFSVYYQDYLVLDKYNHYDGTEAARKTLYLTCGTEVIELDQVKDQLWVPNLAERIMKGETINAKTLDELNICGLTPEVEDATDKAGEYHFKIKPRRGGLGETVLLVNGIEARRYKTTDLKKNGEFFDLIINKAELKNLFIAGKENPVTVKAYTADNDISSRGFKVVEDKTKELAALPNLYAVMVGVSDYKGTELDLKYAAKDATDMSAAVGAAAKKLLNTDGTEHVFMYNLTTANERYQLPEKNSIKKLLEEIGKKATANDILLIFFAGHGVMAGEAEKKQFYFLTADASGFTTTGAVKEVGISTTELVEWMKPQNIKAQKRILIFDACNSGQAINDIAGKDLAVRNDDKAQQTKAIDKLNEKSGLFILSASASNQAAYEMGRYSQGLLTYSLLKAIKQQPDILEDGKYLDVSRWFNAGKETVTEISKENGARQEPQIVSNTNFNIGIVDNEVMAKIILPQEKPLFAASNFQNSDEAIADDDLELNKLVNLQLNDLSARGTNAAIVYVTATNSPDAYSLSGRYTVTGNAITVSVNIKQNKTIKTKFELKGTKDKLKELAENIAEKAAAGVKQF